jgi:CheY-like chemotaxis protein/anti-sigma regulatory factor (Ser/Thr protein kinase)
LELKLIVTGDASAAYNGDRIRFQQILTNLLGNSVKFTESGSITTELSCEPDGLRLSVTDTGIGIPPERLASIFDPFSQADNSITRKYGGTGLGLTITRDLVKLMNGEMHVESEVGKGSRFSVYLPLTKLERGAVAEPVREARETVGSIAGLNVLVAEDNKTNELLLTRVLKSEGVQYTVTRNGQEALDHFLQHSYDLVLMDVQMPVLDGLTATKRIREFEGDGRRTPIIALTAGASEKNLQHALEAGMDDLLSKPYTRDQFCALLLRWSGRAG